MEQGKSLTTTCLVLAIISAVLNGICVVAYGIMWGILFMFDIGGGFHMNIGGVRFKRSADNIDWDFWMGTFLYIIVPVVSLLNFIFSAVLCNGICKGRPTQVKVYFWYGVVHTALTLIVSVFLLTVDTDFMYISIMIKEQKTVGIYWLVGCALHSLFLVLVHFTHKKLVKDKIRLEDTENCDTKYLIKY